MCTKKSFSLSINWNFGGLFQSEKRPLTFTICGMRDAGGWQLKEAFVRAFQTKTLFPGV